MLNVWLKPVIGMIRKWKEYIDAIRVRSGMPKMDQTVYNSEEKVRELYRRERRVELCFRRQTL